MNIRERLIQIRAHLEAIERELKPESPTVPWREAPEWAQWAAMDKCGDWLWYDNEPSMVDNEWLYDGFDCKCFDAPKHPDWAQSKQRRPE